DQWNADIDDDELNKKTDEGSIKFQASAFNQAGRVFAPRYRQAHIHCYFTEDKASAQKAFELAYQDVKTAFEHYLKFHHQGRPIIIAGHSQGTNHAERLLQEFFIDDTLRSKLVAAYLIGMPVKKDKFENIKPCIDSTDIGCFVSWRTFKNGHELTPNKTSDLVSVTNPLLWTTETTYAPKKMNPGALFYNFEDLKINAVDAQVNKDILWANKPKFRGSIFLRTKNYHIADINFYYVSIRNNAVVRVKAYLNGQK
ncbi:MAG: DUF3089 domain-containing protein, partial [Saprospiraceae bacterium]